MKSVEIIAAGRLSNGPFYDLCRDYAKRMAWSLTIHEIESKYKNSAQIQLDESKKILEKLSPHAYVIAMDERGKNMRSLDFANKIKELQNSGQNHMQFIIGGADGLTADIRNRVNMTLCFGQQTWPHMMVRVMLMEQIYRAQQILAGHPYHRE